MIRLRELELSDAQTIFNWRNEPYILNLGSLKKTVTWDEHLSWIKNTLTGVNRKAFIIEINGVAAGQVRFDKHTESVCYISIYLIKEFSGKGYGIECMRLGCNTIFSEWSDIKIIYALVQLENIISEKAFLKAGFLEDNLIKEEGFKIFSLKRN